MNSSQEKCSRQRRPMMKMISYAMFLFLMRACPSRIAVISAESVCGIYMCTGADGMAIFRHWPGTTRTTQVDLSEPQGAWLDSRLQVRSGIVAITAPPPPPRHPLPILSQTIPLFRMHFA